MIVKRIGPLSIAKVAGLLYGILGFITALVGAALYNAAAGWIGGIEVQIEGGQ